MSAYANLKEDFRNLAVREGATSLRHVEASQEGLAILRDAGEARVQRWLFDLAEGHREVRLGAQRTLVNHFKLGADPEFYFEVNGRRISATDLGLVAAKAFGADNNGRLVELRPKPSRFAVEVVASTYETMQWLEGHLTRQANGTPLAWGARPYAHDDGIGGHVHFGRKRGDMTHEEIRALDATTQAIYRLGVFRDGDIKARMGAQGGYGRWGDIRPQRHGYEYRTIPTWLDSPRLAHLILTLTKLAVHAPQRWHASMSQANDATNTARRLQVLLGYYRDVDDDAAIALRGVRQWGWPKWDGTPINSRWGLAGRAEAPKLDFLPTCFAPSTRAIEAVYGALMLGMPLPQLQLVPNWEPAKLPEAVFDMVYTLSDGTVRQPGVGELVAGLVSSGSLWRIRHGANWAGAHVQIKAGSRKFRPEALAFMNEVAAPVVVHVAPRAYHEGFELLVPNAEALTRYKAELQRLLTCGVFPVWRAEDTREDSLAKWKETSSKWYEVPAGKREPKLYGKVVEEQV